ncbi:hypothetical protein IID27_00460 [Patescibacteria group bacterium]|nr:hypothetical protein [Patescibacteria group bacterium]
MLKRLLLKKMLGKQLAGMPEEEQEKMLSMIEKNPELFQKMAFEIQGKIKGGKDQMTATLEVTQKYQAELSETLK